MSSEGAPVGATSAGVNNAPLYFTGICVALLAGMGLIVTIQSFIRMMNTLDLVAKALGV